MRLIGYCAWQCGLEEQRSPRGSVQMVPSTEFSLSRPLSVLITIDDLAVGTLSAPPVLHIPDEGDAICFLLICVFHLSSYPECCDWPSHFHCGRLSYLSLRCWSNPSILCSNKHFSFSSSTSPAGDLPPLFSPHCSSLPSLFSSVLPDDPGAGGV